MGVQVMCEYNCVCMRVCMRVRVYACARAGCVRVCLRVYTCVVKCQRCAVAVVGDGCKARGGWCVNICRRGYNGACAKGQLVGGLCPGRPTRRCCIGDDTGRSTPHLP